MVEDALGSRGVDNGDSRAEVGDPNRGGVVADEDVFLRQVSGESCFFRMVSGNHTTISKPNNAVVGDINGDINGDLNGDDDLLLRQVSGGNGGVFFRQVSGNATPAGAAEDFFFRQVSGQPTSSGAS